MMVISNADMRVLHEQWANAKSAMTFVMAMSDMAIDKVQRSHEQWCQDSLDAVLPKADMPRLDVFQDRLKDAAFLRENAKSCNASGDLVRTGYETDVGNADLDQHYLKSIYRLAAGIVQSAAEWDVKYQSNIVDIVGPARRLRRHFGEAFLDAPIEYEEGLLKPLDQYSSDKERTKALTDLVYIDIKYGDTKQLDMYLDDMRIDMYEMGKRSNLKEFASPAMTQSKLVGSAGYDAMLGKLAVDIVNQKFDVSTLKSPADAKPVEYDAERLSHVAEISDVLEDSLDEVGFAVV